MSPRKSKRLTWCAVALSLAVLPGCMTAEQQQAAQARHMNRLVGLTMADFMAQTGLVPRDYYQTASGRTFLVEGTPRAMGYPSVYGAPAVSVDTTCRMQLGAVRSSPDGGADGWTITSVNWRGGCADI